MTKRSNYLSFSYDAPSVGIAASTVSYVRFYHPFPDITAAFKCEKKRSCDSLETGVW